MKKMYAAKYFYGLVILGLFSQSSIAADIAQGKIKAAVCAGCHGAAGIGLNDEFPNLAGQKTAYLEKQLKAFKSGARSNATMNTMASALSNNDMANLAAYFSGLNGQQKCRPKNRVTDIHPSRTEFPQNIFVSIKKGNGIVRLPDEAFWAGGPNMLYDAITPDKKYLLATSPDTDHLYVFDILTGRQHNRQ